MNDKMKQWKKKRKKMRERQYFKILEATFPEL